MVGPAAQREAVAHLQAELGLSERRACSIVSADRKMIRYRSCRRPDTELRIELRELAHARRRFGYRRLFVLLRQRGEPSGDQPDLPAVSRGGPDRTQAARPPPRCGRTGSNPGRGQAECPLVAGLCPMTSSRAVGVSGS
ncbi:hypothetical protein ACVWZZ_005870 [Bradyrhizobium sp. LM6.10]